MKKVPATTQINFQKIIGHCQHRQVWRGASVAKKYIITDVPMDAWKGACDGLGVDCKDAGLSSNVIVLTGSCKEVIIPIIAQGTKRRLRVWIERSGCFHATYLEKGSDTQEETFTQKEGRTCRTAHRERFTRTSA